MHIDIDKDISKKFILFYFILLFIKNRIIFLI